MLKRETAKEDQENTNKKGPLRGLKIIYFDKLRKELEGLELSLS